ncbi:MAG: PEP-utilizing enzyme [Candidatus Bathyarchaeota archaeon]|nr:PEP-utilizing enzyme [Candidatus Bathyarchaeota archaeon]
MADKILIKGLGASSGISSGIAKVVFSPEEATKKIGNGDILITIATDPDFAPFMSKASAIVTDIGGMLSHAAIVARELGIPCVVGCVDATKVLKDGMKVTVDGSAGLVFQEVEK